ncbi:MAG: universal stress protein [Chloroflexi bacterium]|nr:universal stress protein [Chloroflexota bacterium]
MFKKILVCLDGSALAEQILPYAAEQALCCRSELVLIHVSVITEIVTPGIPGYGPAVLQPTPATLGRIEKEEEAAGDYLERLAQPLREKGLKVECVPVAGTPGEVIVAYADEREIELIALATHGRSGLGRMVFGSVADFVLRKSGKPILLIKPT